MTTTTSTLTAAEVATFWRDGVVRVRGAFAVDDAAAMRDVVWRDLAHRGVNRHDPATWHQRAVDHLQHLKTEPAFRRIGAPRTLGAIADLVSGWPTGPDDWGAFFLLFPARARWTVPWKAWHVDHQWTTPLDPLRELKVHSMFGDVAPRAGGMTVVAGSHRLVAAALRADPPPPGERAARRGRG
jgi:hypothetical protein